MTKTKYLIDANVFIQAKDMYYRFDFCGGFWDWMKAAHAAGHVCSCRKVLNELAAGPKGDPAHAWAVALTPTFFLPDTQDSAVMNHYNTIMAWANGSKYNQAAKNHFAKATTADAFLIAVAKQHGYRIATQEKSNPDTKKKIYLPDAAKENGVETVYVYDMLSELADSTFVMKAKPAVTLASLATPTAAAISPIKTQPINPA